MHKRIGALVGTAALIAGMGMSSNTTALAASVLSNGGFEAGTSPWQQSTANSHGGVSSGTAHTGSYSAQLCGYDSCDDRIWQNFTVPSNVSQATVTYWVEASSQGGTACSDWVRMRLLDANGAKLNAYPTTCNSNTGWVQKTFDVTSVVSSRSGQQLQLDFHAFGDASATSTFSVDDVNLDITTGTSGDTGACPGSQNGCIQAMLNMLNQARANNGVSALTINWTETNGTSTCVGSYSHSVHMAQMGKISHDQFPKDICIKYTITGENVGQAKFGNELTDLQKVHAAMMSEPHTSSTCSRSVNHACNIINPKYHQVGIGIYNTTSGTWLTEDFTN